MRASQQKTLQMTAEAVALSLKPDRHVSNVLKRSANPSNVQQVYLHTLPTDSMIVDGYNDEWRSQGLVPQRFAQNDDSAIEIYGATDQQRFWLSIDVHKETINYYHPSTSGREADGIQLTASNLTEKRTTFLIVASGPGPATVFAHAEFEAPKIDSRIKAVWLETPNGYRVELYGSLSQIKTGLHLTTISPSAIPSDPPNTIGSPSYADPYINEKLQAFSGNSLQAYLASPQGNILAIAGETQGNGIQETPWLLSKLFEAILQQPDFTAIAAPEATGHLPNKLLREKDSALISINGQHIMMTSAALQADALAPSYIVLAQNLNELRNTRDSAITRLIAYSTMVTVLAAIVLAGYASWLSYRIQMLSRSTSSALEENRQLKQTYKSSRLNDEIGDLSRNFGLMLEQVSDYTNYLRTLSGKLSHELRTPLAIVSSSLDNLEQETLSDEASTYAKRAKEGAVRLSTILNAMSAATRVEQAVQAPEFEILRIDHFIEEISFAYRDIHPSHQFEFDTEGDTKYFEIDAAPELLAQMLDKLIDNAVDFSQKNSSIRLTAIAKEDDIRLSVSNTGPALPAGMEQQLFDSLVSIRDEKRGNNERPNLGLGLYIAALIVECHRGVINAKNIENTGVSFEIRLPRKQTG